MPSRVKWSTAASVGHTSTLDKRSVSTRLISSGIDHRCDRSPASTCTNGTPSAEAAQAPAKVESVSPKTSTHCGLWERMASRTPCIMSPKRSSRLSLRGERVTWGWGKPSSRKN